MFGSFLPSLWSLSNHSLLGSRSRHCYAINENHLLHALHVSNCGFRTKNFFEHHGDFIVRSNFPFASQSLSNRALFLDDYIPLAFVLILSGTVGVATHTEIVRVASNNRWKFPSPVFLIGLPNLDVPFD